MRRENVDANGNRKTPHRNPTKFIIYDAFTTNTLLNPTRYHKINHFLPRFAQHVALQVDTIRVFHLEADLFPEVHKTAAPRAQYPKTTFQDCKHEGKNVYHFLIDDFFQFFINATKEIFNEEMNNENPGLNRRHNPYVETFPSWKKYFKKF